MTTGIGATRHRDLVGGASVEERVVGWKEGKWYRIDVYERHNMPMITSMFGEMEIEALPDGNSESIMTFDYEIESEPDEPAAMEKMMHEQLTMSAIQATAGFKRRIETGETIDAETELDLSSVVAVGWRRIDR